MDDRQQKALESNFRAAGGSLRSSARKPAVKPPEACVSNVRKPPVGHIAGIEKNVLGDPLCAAVSEVLGTSFGPESCNPLESII